MQATAQAAQQIKLELAAEILGAGGSISVRALGTSMIPSIWPGDLLMIDSISPQQIMTGDVILFRQQSRFYIHRVVRTDTYGGSWITRGDALLEQDPPVRPSELLGRVVAIERNGRSIQPTRQSRCSYVVSFLLARWDALHNVALRIHRLIAPAPTQPAKTMSCYSE